MAPGKASHPIADRAANAAPDARERREGIGFRENGVNLEEVPQFFEDAGRLLTNHRQFDARE